MLQSNGSRQRGTVSFINDEENINKTYDIIYDARNGNVEECGVQPSRLSPFEDFELDTSPERRTANQLKEDGNALFRLKDYDAAMSYYQSSLCTLLRPFSFSVGSTVLVQRSPSVYVSGMICDVNDSDSLYEVVYDDEQQEDSTEPGSRLVSLATAYPDNSSVPITQTVAPSSSSALSSSPIEQPIDPIELQRSIYMNLTRCCLQKPVPTPGWACKYATLAVAITKYNNNQTNNQDHEKGVKQLADALFLRCKSFLAASRPHLARTDAIELQSLDQPKATQLIKEIDAFLLKRQKSNRKLARDVAEWVETAMQIHQNCKDTKRNDNLDCEDLDVDVDFEDEEDDG